MVRLGVTLVTKNEKNCYCPFDVVVTSKGVPLLKDTKKIKKFPFSDGSSTPETDPNRAGRRQQVFDTITTIAGLSG